MNELPIARGLILCEKIITEETTRHVTLVNCFSNRRFDRFPSQPLDFFVYAVLLNGRGRIRVDVVIEDVDTSNEIERRSVVMNIVDPKQEVRFRSRFKEYVFRRPRGYEFKLLADGEMIANTTLDVVE